MHNLKFHRGALLSLTVGICAVSGAAGQGSRAAPKKWPPQFPREGATKLFENDRIIVWEQVGRPKEPFMHMHVGDTIVFGIQGGRVDTLGVDGKKKQQFGWFERF